MTERDGFEVVSFDTGEVVHFIECKYDDSQRDKVEMGLLRNMNLDKFFVRDTRDRAEAES